MLGLGINMALGRQRFGASAFSWATYGNAVHWWHAEDGASAGAALPDRIGSADLAVDSGSPAYSSTGWGGTHPVITHASADTTKASVTVGNGTKQPWTLSASVANASSGAGRWINLENTAARQMHGLNNSTNFQITRNVVSQFETLDTGVPVDANRHVLTAAYDGTSTTCYIDGTRVINAGTYTSAVDAVVVNALVIGGWIRDGSSLVSNSTVDVGEIVLYDEGVADTGALAALHAAHLARWPVA